jgi:hypothetical protein
MLYPTKKMRHAVAELYAFIIRFLMRAQDWYHENKLRHILHSLTRPVELRFADLIDEMEACTRTVDNLASAGARAEQRDMHLKLQVLMRKQEEMNVMIMSES